MFFFHPGLSTKVFIRSFSGNKFSRDRKLTKCGSLGTGDEGVRKEERRKGGAELDHFPIFFFFSV